MKVDKSRMQDIFFLHVRNQIYILWNNSFSFIFQEYISRKCVVFLFDSIISNKGMKVKCYIQHLYLQSEPSFNDCVPLYRLQIRLKMSCI